MAYDRARQADVVVTNHALLLIQNDWEVIGLPFTRVVIDVAHIFEVSATDPATFVINNRRDINISEETCEGV